MDARPAGRPACTPASSPRGATRRYIMRLRAEAELGTEELVTLWTAITQRVVDYGFKLEYARLERPKLGIFDGLRLVIDPAVDFEMQCFLVLHLFGHSVQWVAPSYRPEILAVPEPEQDLEVYLNALESYER